MQGETKENGPEGTDPLVGKVIHDRFRIIAPIARGGMGAVYKAEQAPLGRLVALKVLSPKHDEEQDPEFRKRFFLEAATVARLSHPNTVTVFDYGQSDNTYFIVMELITGVTLKKALRTAGHFDSARAFHVAKQICRSLREAHRLGVIHRDMKPGNVMLVEQGDEHDYVKVLDFGLVKDIEKPDDEEDLTQTGVFMGSPKYMSPEQIQGLAVDARSDIYSVGILLFEMLTGRPPFVREKQVQILMDHINAPLPPLVTPDGHAVPEEIAQVVVKCLAKQPDQRFDDMEQLLLAMKMAAGDMRMSMPPSGELGLTGEFGFRGTPVSGIHIAGDPRTASSAIKAPTVTSSVSGSASLSPPSSTLSAAEVLDARNVGGKVVIGLGAVAFLAAAALLFVAFNPLSSDDAEADPPIAEAAPLVPPTSPVDGTAAGETSAAAEPPSPIVSVLVELESRPEGATVRVGESSYGPTPLSVELTGAQATPGTELTFVFEMQGYRETTVVRTVPSAGRMDVSARMRRTHQVAARPNQEREEPQQQTVTPAGYRESPY